MNIHDYKETIFNDKTIGNVNDICNSNKNIVIP